MADQPWGRPLEGGQRNVFSTPHHPRSLWSRHRKHSVYATSGGAARKARVVGVSSIVTPLLHLDASNRTNINASGAVGGANLADFDAVSSVYVRGTAQTGSYYLSAWITADHATPGTSSTPLWSSGSLGAPDQGFAFDGSSMLRNATSGINEARAISVLAVVSPSAFSTHYGKVQCLVDLGGQKNGGLKVFVTSGATYQYAYADASAFGSIDTGEWNGKVVGTTSAIHRKHAFLLSVTNGQRVGASGQPSSTGAAGFGQVKFSYWNTSTISTIIDNTFVGPSGSGPVSANVFGDIVVGTDTDLKHQDAGTTLFATANHIRGFRGKIHELIVFPEFPSADVVTALHRYTLNKWQL